MTGDDIDKWIDATLEGWDPSKEGWGPSEFDDVEAGPPLSIDELKRAHEDLAVWHSPLDFRRTVARLHKRCRSSEIFNDPKRASISPLHDFGLPVRTSDGQTAVRKPKQVS